MHKLTLFLLVAVLFCAGSCAVPPVSQTPTSIAAIPTFTFTATATSTTTPTPTATITPTPTWVHQPAGRITCPILLYHRISVPSDDDELGARYFIPPADFDMQMQALDNWGYTTIPLSLLITAITQGAPLPPRPIVITFDDGDLSVYSDAFSIMQRYGYTGVIYLVVNYIGQDGYMDVEEVQTLLAAGWEAGSHSRNHINLVAFPETMNDEGYRSRLELEDLLDAPIETFAYPFGEASDFVIDHIDGYGYRAAMGLGLYYEHTPASLFYLSRIEIRNGTTLADMAEMLPWSGLLGDDATMTP